MRKPIGRAPRAVSWLLGISMMLAAVPGRAGDPPRVAASIAPVHALAAGVMTGIGTPDLIVRGYGSPHSYQMRPSEARALAAADVIVWIGAPLETFLIGPIESLGANARVIALLDADGVEILTWRNPDTEPDDPEPDHDHDHRGVDPHIWLSPANAKAMVDAIVAALSDFDPARADTYLANGDVLKTRLDRLDQEIRSTLAGVSEIPFLVFHDVIRYFAQAYDLHPIGAVTASPDRRPGARRLRDLKRTIADTGTTCVLVEPQISSSLIDNLVDDDTTTRAAFDPLGATLPHGPDAYFEMMRTNARNLAACLAGGGPADPG